MISSLTFDIKWLTFGGKKEELIIPGVYSTDFSATLLLSISLASSGTVVNFFGF